MEKERGYTANQLSYETLNRSQEAVY